MLPLEKPCTENLTPFISLLPCRSHAGLGQLLKPNHLFDSDWQKISISVKKIAEDRMELSLELEMVSNPVRLDLSKSGTGRRGWFFTLRARSVILIRDGKFQQIGH